MFQHCLEYAQSKARTGSLTPDLDTAICTRSRTPVTFSSGYALAPAMCMSSNLRQQFPGTR
eukprot:12926238-Prorocentrum_lima.AAC.1